MNTGLNCNLDVHSSKELGFFNPRSQLNSTVVTYSEDLNNKLVQDSNDSNLFDR